MIIVEEVQQGFHHIGRYVFDFDFSSGCFNHAAAAIAQHTFENFALIAQDDLIE